MKESEKQAQASARYNSDLYYGRIGQSGFGLAQIKKEGMSFSPNNPELGCWDGLVSKRDGYLKILYPKWYQKPLRNAAKKAWDIALKENAKKEQV